VKTCSQCSTPKPLSEFYNDDEMMDGKRSRCKACTNTPDRSRRARFNDISDEQLTAMADKNRPPHVQRPEYPFRSSPK
jgi:hypothetical protein